MTPIEELKIMIRERDYPYFSDEELQYHLDKEGSIQGAAYSCLILKSEDTTLSVSGLNLGDTSKYFRRLADKYRPNHSRLLGGS